MGRFFTNFCLRILYYIYIKYRIFFAYELKSGKFRKIQLANYKLDIKYTQTKHQTFPTMSHCIKSQQMRYFTGFAFCRDRKSGTFQKYHSLRQTTLQNVPAVLFSLIDSFQPPSFCSFLQRIIVHYRKIG